jgi:hypothetical protein
VESKTFLVQTIIIIIVNLKYKRVIFHNILPSRLYVANILFLGEKTNLIREVIL